MISTTFVFLSSIIGVAYATANDWSQPCLSGVCFYDLPSSAGAASGTLKVWGSPDSITDITAAAGWEILDCNQDSLSQDIRLVCTGNENCNHLYRTVGAVGKVVRLPERCGQNAFAHISRAWVPEDQSIPENIARRLVKRGVQPEVKALHIDTDFSAVDPAKIGIVNFSIQAANVPGADARRPSRVAKRQFGFVRDAIDAVTDLNEVSIDQTATLDPFSINQTFNILDETLSCPPIEARLKMDVTAKAHAVATIGVAAEGTIVPPRIDDFAITSTLTADLNGAINLSGGLSGSIESEKLRLFEVGIPGLSFPGILTIGPSFAIDAQAVANLDVNADLSVGVNYKIDKATLVFPPSSGNAKARNDAFKLRNTPLKLSVSPSVQATGSVEGHLIPSLNLGISALGGVADASVFLELDASATLQLSLEGRAEASATVNGLRTRDEPDIGSASVASRVGRAVARRQAAGGAPTGTGRRVTTAASASFGGCFEILAGLDVNAGANAEFFGLFDAETSVSLFSREFELFRRCFGAPQQRRALRFARRHDSDYTPRAIETLKTLGKRELECPVAAAPALETLADGVVSAQTVRAT